MQRNEQWTQGYADDCTPYRWWDFKSVGFSSGYYRTSAHLQAELPVCHQSFRAPTHDPRREASAMPAPQGRRSTPDLAESTREGFALESAAGAPGSSAGAAGPSRSMSAGPPRRDSSYEFQGWEPRGETRRCFAKRDGQNRTSWQRFSRSTYKFFSKSHKKWIDKRPQHMCLGWSGTLLLRHANSYDGTPVDLDTNGMMDVETFMSY